LSFARDAFRSGIWLAVFKFVAQAFSWVVTIQIARLLRPEDYGLMGMAGILAGYIQLFSEMGLGAAIIQKPDLNQKELSSIFWFTSALGVLFAFAGFLLAYPTSLLFREPRVIPITKVISALFVFGSLTIVPINLMKKEARFKEIGQIQFAAAVVSSLIALVLAYKGFGVWALAGAAISLNLFTMLLTVRACRWRPSLHFNFGETKTLLKFGLNVAVANTLYYLFDQSDILIVGKLFNARMLGYYSMATKLASVPSDKIVSIITQVSYPVFAKYQGDSDMSREVYLRITELTVLLTAPMFLGCALFADQLIPLLLGPRWLPTVYFFKVLCVAKMCASLMSLNSAINTAQGRPHWASWVNLASLATMAPAFVVCGRQGFHSLGVPWLSIYPVIYALWTAVTLRKIHVQIRNYLGIIAPTILSTVLIVVLSQSLYSVVGPFITLGLNRLLISLIQQGVFCLLLYSVYVLYMEKSVIQKLWHTLMHQD
jgi:O-antigen/teichoic acid export membrane protein